MIDGRTLRSTGPRASCACVFHPRFALWRPVTANVKGHWPTMRAKYWVFWSGLLAVPIGLIAWVGFVEADAKQKAHAFCERFPVGSALADVAAAAADVGDKRHRVIRANDVSIAFVGVPPFSRHVCTFDGQSGKVTRARYLHLD